MPEEKAPDCHVTEAVTTSKEADKGFVWKVLGFFFADDVGAVTGSIMDDFVKPRMDQYKKQSRRKMQEFIADSLEDFIEMIFLGKTRKKISKDGSTQYWKMSNGNSIEEAMNKPKDAYYGLKAYVIEDRSKAEEALNEMKFICDRYNRVTVAEYYGVIGQPNTRIDSYYGWFDLVGVDVKRVPGGGGYVIDLPKPVSLNG